MVRDDRLLDQLRRLDADDAARNRGETVNPLAPSRPPSKSRGPLAAIGAVLLLILVKGKGIALFVLLKLKTLLAAFKLGPILTTLSTMGVSIVAYSQFYGLALAAWVVGLILVHELGHGAAAKIMGLKVGAPIFIPFFGAFIALKEQPRTTFVDAVLSFGGPFAGLLGGAAVFACAPYIESDHDRGILVVAAWITASINLFNLIPVLGLDGDGITRPLRPLHWVLATAVAVSALVWRHDSTGTLEPFLLIIALCAAVKTVTRWFADRKAMRGAVDPERLLDRLQPRRYVDEDTVTIGQRQTALCAYGALLFGLTWLAMTAQASLPPLPR